MSDRATIRADRTTDVLVLGLGNVLLGDDGIGAAALARLSRNYRVPPGVKLEDGGTLGLSLLDLIAEAERVILVDAVRAEAAPGTLVRIDGDDVMDAVRDRLSPHQVGVADVLDAARLINRYPSVVTLIGLVPEALDLNFARSRAVETNLDELVAAIACEVESFGYRLLPQTGGANCDLPGCDLADRIGL